jgi:2-dehydropantoate 2-reductase
MKAIKNVSILGAGAIGAAEASIFHDSGDFSVSLIARDERFERLERDGLVVNGKQYNLPVIHPDRADEPSDLIIVALKHHQLEPAMGDLKGLVGGDTLIISLMNGLDSEEMLGAVYGMEHILYSLIIGIDAVRQGNQINYSIPGKIYFGKADYHQITTNVRRVQYAFDRANIIHETPPDMLRMLWWKLMVNVGVNQASAVMRAPYGVFQTMPDAQWLMESLMGELIDLAECAGVDLKREDIRDWYGFMNKLSPEGKTSMLQDVDAGRKTETDIFAGKVVELGKRYNRPTPVNETVWRIIHVMEARYDQV